MSESVRLRSDRLLSEASDSTLLDLKSLYEGDGDRVTLRLRLQLMTQILFGQRLLITEGWALDSLAFLTVAEEVIRAIPKARSTGVAKRIPNYSPIIMESRRNGNYTQIMSDYMWRDDIRWSGFRPTLTREGQADIKERLRASIVERRPDIKRIFMDSLHDDGVTDSLAVVAEYFDSMPEDRIKRADEKLTPYLFDQSFRAIFKAREANGENTEEEEALLHVYQQKFAGPPFSSSSQALRLAEEVKDPEFRAAFLRCIKYAYMNVGATAGGAVLTTPAIAAGESTFSWITENWINSAARRLFDESRLRFSDSLPEENALLDKLALQVNWSEIWPQTIALSHSEQWRAAIRVLAEFALAEKEKKKVLESKPYFELKRLLEEHVPDVVLRQSPLEKTRISVGARLGKLVGPVAYDTGMYALGAGSLFLLHHFHFSLLDAIFVDPGMGFVGSEVKRRIIPKLANWDPSSKEKDAVLSSLITPLDVTLR